MIDEKYPKKYKQQLSEAFATRKNISMSPDDLNKGFDHLLGLLDVAVELYCLRKYNISAFLAITAIEEKVKLEIYSYQSFNQICSGSSENSKSEKRSFLYNHRLKHNIAPSPVISIFSVTP